MFRAGESLQLVVQGDDLQVYPQRVFAQAHACTINAGQHIVHAGGAHDSQLLVPVIDA